MSEFDVERHDGDEPAICVGQWCCGCTEHPSGKPWGWNHRAWSDHRLACHPPTRALEGSQPSPEEGQS